MPAYTHTRAKENKSRTIPIKKERKKKSIIAYWKFVLFPTFWTCLKNDHNPMYASVCVCVCFGSRLIFSHCWRHHFGMNKRWLLCHKPSRPYKRKTFSSSSSLSSFLLYFFVSLCVHVCVCWGHTNTHTHMKNHFIILVKSHKLTNEKEKRERERQAAKFK